MTIEEMVRRILRAHWVTIAVCIALPLLAVAALQLRQGTEHVATVRVQVAAKAPSSTTEADATSSRVLALATTPELVGRALADAHVTANAGTLAREAVTTQRLGESSVVELSVRMPEAADARAVVVALAQRVSSFMNEAGQAPFDARIAAVRKDLGSATAVRDQLARRLAAATQAAQSAPRAPGVSAPSTSGLEARLAGAQSTVDQLIQAENQLALTASTRDLAVLVDGSRPEVTAVAPTLLPRMALAVLLGLLVGLTVSLLLETLRPRMAGARAVARRFDAPVLGDTGQRLAAQVNSMTLGARRQGLETVVLLGVDGDSQRTASRLLGTLEGPAMAGVNGAKTRASSYAASGEPGTSHDVQAGALAPLPTTVRFTDLEGVGADQEMSAGVVVVTSPAPLQSDVDVVEDVLRTMRWPVIGILAAARANGSVRL